ncbi:hypothetical protein MOQ_007880 [Trypanosoma cruzi marinkellei]|uniref:Calponin-homology (CH) domain-containing protein n=1 Tax=Trypanosoma cruzi marinkellei TaxID=85056 RepID=K2MRS5_TRYCR|nr:hypothetical protein MOQ_007880 [Trypanosoma cruzi marinkellei]
MPLPKCWQTVSLPELVPSRRAAGGTAAAPPAAAVVVPSSVSSPNFDEEAAVDTDRKIERHRYAKLLLRHVPRYQQFTSVDLFAETFLRDIALQDGVTLQTRAAAATWVMKLICSSSSKKRLMEALMDALFPAIYRDYDEQKLDHAPPSIQALVNDRTLLRDNPYFSHSMYMQDIVVSDATIETLSRKVQRTLPAIMQWKRFVVILVEYVRNTIKRRAFSAWWKIARRRRVEDLLRRNVIIRHEKNIRSSRLQAAFFRWKTAVEASRTEYLTERLHQAAFQLESAKNQFQMQCFRSDKLQLSYEQGQADIESLIGERNELCRRVEGLNETLALKEKEHQDRMKNCVKEIVTLVQQQRCVLRRAIDARLCVEEITAGWLDEAISEFKSKVADEEAFPPSYKCLLKWCNQIYSKQGGKKPLRVSNFAADFANGEAYYLLLQYVFSEDQLATIKPPPLPMWLSKVNKTERLNRVCAFAASTPLANVLESVDLSQKREDKIAAAVAEIFLYHIGEKRVMYTNKALQLVDDVALRCEPGANNFAVARNTPTRTASASGKDNDSDSDDGFGGGAGFHDEETLRRQVMEWGGELEQWETELQRNVVQENNLQHCGAAIAHDAAHMMRERSKGQPVYVVTSSTGLIFTSVNAKNMEDLRTKFKMPNPQGWKTLVRVALKNVLWKHVRLIASHFYHFAGVDAQRMSEVQFWRFVEETQVAAEPLTPLVAMQIFDVVVSPQIAAIWRTASKDEKREKMLEAVQEQIEIRFLKPNQFTETLVRFAVARYKGGIIEVTDHFLSGLPLPVMQRILPVTPLFYEPEPQRVMNYFQHDMARVFFFYMNHQLNESLKGRSLKVHGCGRFMARLSYTTYIKMFADCDFILPEQDDDSGSVLGYQRKTRFMSIDEVLKMLEDVKRRIPSISPGELCFSLFLETFGVACVYWWPDPAVPLSRKLAAFLSRLVEKLRAVFASDVLVLGDPPGVSLEGGAHVELS